MAAKKKSKLKAKIVEIKKERSMLLEEQGEAVRRVQVLAEEEGFSRVSLKNDLGKVWEFEFYP